MTEAVRGWDSNFKTFRGDDLGEILTALKRVVGNAGKPQERAWRESIPRLQTEVGELVEIDTLSGTYTAVLEYQLPLEYRRVDAVFLMHDAVVVIELKGKREPSLADLDQAQAYARDLRAYHAECESRHVRTVLIPTVAKGLSEVRGEVHVCSPELLDKLLQQLNSKEAEAAVDARRFLSEEAYRPLPTLVRAARELFATGELRRVKRAAAATERATDALLQIVREAALQKRRKLVLLSGVPGAGKTLVGLRLVHSHEIDKLAVARAEGLPTASAVFLSGNGPLVEVLSYELRDAGGNGHAFVRGVKKYVERFSRNPRLIPPEHVLVYDEAQRAFDAAMVAATHGQDIAHAKSEPELFIEFAERVPEWCVVVALVGSGQEIHKGEEAGIGQWARAIQASARAGEWDLHGPVGFADEFDGLRYTRDVDLSLDKSLRSHLAFEVHRFVAGLVSFASEESQDEQHSVAAARLVAAEHRPSYSSSMSSSRPRELQVLAQKIAKDGHHLRISRSLELAKAYLRDRYEEDPHARYGLIASSRDRDLASFGINNDYQSTKRVKYGPWYGDDEQSPGQLSCRHLRECVTEFGAQGLELDGALVAWGTDFLMTDGHWDIGRARGYKAGGAVVRDAAQLRANAYRVLLTRARDCTVVFVPPLPIMDETYEFLRTSGFEELNQCGSVTTL
jgi:hypothetical protein